MKDFRVEPSPCPHCGQVLDGASNVTNDERPEPGDVTVCIICAGLAEFDEDMNLTMPSEAKKKDALTHEEVVAAIFAVRAVHENQGPRP